MSRPRKGRALLTVAAGAALVMTGCSVQPTGNLMAIDCKAHPELCEPVDSGTPDGGVTDGGTPDGGTGGDH